MSYKPSPEVLSARMAGETVLLDMRTRNYFQLNATAARVWEGLERGWSEEELLIDLESRFDAPREQIEAEARQLLAGLLDRGLIAPAQ